MKYVDNISFIKGSPVLVRLGLNVPLVDGVPRSTFRLRRAFKTISYLQKKGARVIIIGHIGREPFATLRPVYEYMRKHIPQLHFCEHVCGAVAREAVAELAPGEVLMLENLRRNQGEIANSPEFVKELASLADVFVQDAFDTCHRNHASIVGIPTLLPSYAGFLIKEEVQELSRALKPSKPSLAVIGGAKFNTKAPLITKLLNTYTRVFIGGALGNDLLLARGYNVGQSVISGKTHLLRDIAHNPCAIGPLDVLIEGGEVRSLEKIKDSDVIVDVGPQTLNFLQNVVSESKNVLWNGPLGFYERGYTEGTEQLAQFVAQSNTHGVLGGGDTVASIEALSLEDDITFISTGGGAMLDFLTHGTLPGIEALN